MENKQNENLEMHPKEKNFFRETCNALLGIERPNIPERVQNFAKDKGLKEKPEFHISVLASKNGKKIMDKIKGLANAEEIKDEIENKFKNTNWSYLPVDRFYFLEKEYSLEDLEKSGYVDVPPHSRFTIVEEFRLSEIEPFFAWLKEKLDIDFDVPSIHVTLYSGAGYEPLADRGIGIYSEKDLQDYMKQEI